MDEQSIKVERWAPSFERNTWVWAWRFVCYTNTVEGARRMVEDFAIVGQPVRAVDLEGNELCRHVHKADPQTYAED